MRSNADVAPLAHAQLIRGAVAASMVVSWRLILRTPNRSHRPRPSPCGPARRALLLPLSGQPRPDGMEFQSLRSFYSLQSFHSMPLAGIRYGVGVAWRHNLAPSVDHFGCHPHACAQGVFYVLVVGSEAPER